MERIGENFLMFDIKNYITEANARQKYEAEHRDAVAALKNLAQVVENFKSPIESWAPPDSAYERDAANIMAKFVDKVNKLQREWFNMSRKI